GRAHSEAQFDPRIGETVTEVADRFVEFLLARNAPRHVELAADRVGFVVQRDGMAAFGERAGRRESGRPGADDRKAASCRNGPDNELGFMAGARVDEATRDLLLEHVVKAGLVAR